MIRRLKHSLIPAYLYLSVLRGKKRFSRLEDRPTAFLLLTPDYGNVGDLAIGVAEREYVERTHPGYQVVSVPLAETYAVLRSIRRDSRQGDIVFLVGGGSTGDLYPRAHFGRIFVVKYLRKLPVVSFPQSVIYSSEKARRVFGAREARAFRKHPRLRLFAREETSLKIMREVFGGDIGYAPDIVLSTSVAPLNDAPRSNVLLVLRGDSERSLSQNDHLAIRKTAESLGGTIVSQDHEVGASPLNDSTPSQVVNRMMDEYLRARVVITDRLHGMIFAAITRTPCVVLPNSNHKISGTYDAWLRKECPFILFAEGRDIESLRRTVEAVLAAPPASAPSMNFESFNAAVREFVTVN